MSNWNQISGIVQGDFSFEIKRQKLYMDTVNIILTAYSEKWTEIDVSFEYLMDGEWRKDAKVLFSSGRIENNRIYGLSASKYGSNNIITWKYIDNHFRYGMEPEIRIKVLPRIKYFSTSGRYHLVTNSYGEQTVDIIEGSTAHKCVGTNNKGQVICLSGDYIFIKQSPSSEVLYSYRWLLNPSMAIQKLDGNYLVADTGKNRVIELAEDLSSILYDYTINHPVYLDYSETRESLLITMHNTIYEVTWSDLSRGVITWQSDGISLQEPYSATFKQGSSGSIVIADTGNNQVVLYDGNTNQYTRYGKYKISTDDDSLGEQTDFWMPYRAFWSEDGDICVIEREGKPWGFESELMSSSSESSDG